MKPKKTFYRTKRTSALTMLRWGMAKEPKRVPTSRLDKEWIRQCNKLQKHNRRAAIGLVRAFCGPHFFAGVAVGAENE